MANEITFSWYAGQTGLTANVFASGGADRETDIALTENDTGGLYLGDCATLTAGDTIMIYQNATYVSSQSYHGRTITHKSTWIVRNA